MIHPYLKEANNPQVDMAKELAAGVLAENAPAVDDAGQFPTENIAALRDAGLLGLCVSKELGGGGEGMRTFAAVVEEIATACPSTAMIYVMHVTAAQAIASSELKNRESILRDIAAGKHLTTLAFSETGSRSQFWAPISKLVSDGKDGFTTSASKSWVTAADHADSYVSSAQMPGARSPLESTVYLIKRGAPGVKTSGQFRGLGLRGNDSSPVAIDKAAVGAGDLISKQGEGANTMLQVVLPWFSIGTAAMANGICRAALDRTAMHMSGAGFEHTGTSLRDLPTLRARIANMGVRTSQSRALLGYTLATIESGAAEAPLYVLQSRLSSIEAAADVTDDAMRICGGAAFSKHLGVERFFRDARAGSVMAPTSDHLRDFVGRVLTGLPLF